MRSAYEARVTAQAKEGTAPVFDPNVLIHELRNEFVNWRATHPYQSKASPASKTDKKEGKPVYKGGSTSRGAHANAATPYSKPAAKPAKSNADMTCFNCNKKGHGTITCPEAWTEKSKEAMKKKGITCYKTGLPPSAPKHVNASACTSYSASTSLDTQHQNNLALTVAALSAHIEEVNDWLTMVSGGDV